jgi:nicotinamide-nucleotide adenylyltransferase
VKGLFVGRFQPFHLGHLKAIKWILERCEKVTVVIGSSQESLTERNPFTFEERKEMIKRSLEKESVKKERYEIIGVPDVFNCKRWVKSILNKAKFDVVFTRSRWVKQCFDLFEIPVKEHPMFERYSARKIRRMMMKKDKDWEELVPSIVSKSVKEIRGVERLRDLAETDKFSSINT